MVLFEDRFWVWRVQIHRWWSYRATSFIQTVSASMLKFYRTSYMDWFGTIFAVDRARKTPATMSSTITWSMEATRVWNLQTSYARGENKGKQADRKHYISWAVVFNLLCCEFRIVFCFKVWASMLLYFRASAEEVYAKSLQKLAKSATSVSQLG